MTEAEAIKVLEKEKAYMDSHGGDTQSKALEMAIKALEKQEVAKESDWIPVTERLPEPFQRVLVYDAWDDSMTIEHLQENDSFIESVIAWMPLPIAPYQKGE